MSAKCQLDHPMILWATRFKILPLLHPTVKYDLRKLIKVSLCPPLKVVLCELPIPEGNEYAYKLVY